MHNKFYYLIELQFLGFRYHGWQKQKDVKTVQHMLDRTLQFILEHEDYKTLGASRTDAMVSAQHHFCELFIATEIDPKELLVELNKNLPADILCLGIKEVDESFQIISSKKEKEYHYYFSHGEKAHPYCSPFLINYQNDLDIDLMKQAAKLFEGSHNFKLYCYRSSGKTDFERTITTCEIIDNTFLTASFFPKNSFFKKKWAEQ